MTPKSAASLIVILWVGVATALAASGPLETSVDRARAMLIKEDLGDGIFVFRAPSDLEYWTATNSVVIVNDDDVTVFDSPTRAVTARAVIAEVRKLTPKPVRVLINSHWHQDHWSGNDEYARAFPGLRIIATAQTRAYMSRMGPGFFVNEAEGFGLAQVAQGPRDGDCDRQARRRLAVDPRGPRPQGGLDRAGRPVRSRNQGLAARPSKRGV